MTEALAAGATVVAVAFAACLLERWLVRRRHHELAWAIALVLFACGSLALWAGASLGWEAWSFRLFYAFGAVANVPFLALGTVELLAPRAARTARWLVPLGCAFAAGVVLAAPLTAPVPSDALPQGSDVFGVLPRVLAAVASGLGAVVVFAGAAWSAVVRRKERRLAVGNVVIALGTAVLSMSGLLNSALGEMEAFAVTLTAGVTILFAGFLVATAPLPRRRLRVAQLAA
jgi:hypothetical protein